MAMRCVKRMFCITNLHVDVDGKEIVKGVNLSINESEVHAILGPNGSGKSSLCFAIMGHPRYRVKKGKIMFLGKDITKFKTEERAKMGIFLGFQNPVEIEGISVERMLYKALSYAGSVRDNFDNDLKAYAEKLGLSPSILSRDINVGFSGGEKKRSEIVQMLALNPKLAILDEIDSGLDVDSLKSVASVINSKRKNGKGFLIITHYSRILKYVHPDTVHVMVDGRIVRSGSVDLVDKIEKHGYADVL